MSIHLDKISYRYDTRKTDGVEKLDVHINLHKITALIGPSGSGKTTTLKCLAGELTPQKGKINYKTDLAIAYVDQNPNIVNTSQTVYDSLEEIIKDQIDSAESRANQIRSILAQLEITNEINSPVEKLSGGQKQRYIIACALVQNPTLLLLDEPFANLDQLLRTQLLEELFEIFKEKEITVVWVTHNNEEALAYSDQLILLNYGSLQQIGSPQDLYYRPRNLFTAKYFTQTNVLAGKLIVEEENNLTVHILDRDFLIPKHDYSKSNDHNDILVMVHPEHISIHQDGSLLGKVKQTVFMGSRTLVHFESKGVELYAEISSSEPLDSTSINFDLLNNHLYCLS